MNQKTKQLKLYKYLGQQLGIKSVWFLKHAFNVKTIEFTRDELKRIVKEKTGTIAYSADRKHYFTDWDTWRQLIQYDWTDKKKYLKDQYDCKVPVELAWAWGLFFADGSCCLNKDGDYAGACWRIVNTDKALLERAKTALDWEYKDTLTFKIKLYPSYGKGQETNYGKRTKDTYCLEVNPKYCKRKLKKQGLRGDFIKEFKELFYEYGKKIVPKPIWDEYHDSRKAFIEGIWAGDGNHTPLNGNKKRRVISIARNNSRAMAELDWHMWVLGWKRRVDILKKEFRISFIPEGKPMPIACDNYASSFCARMAEIYGLNTAGRLFCDVYNANTGEKIAPHVAVLIVDRDKRVFLMESQNDKVLEITSPTQKLIIGNWEYRNRYVRFN